MSSKQQVKFSIQMIQMNYSMFATLHLSTIVRWVRLLVSQIATNLLLKSRLKMTLSSVNDLNGEDQKWFLEQNQRHGVWTLHNLIPTKRSWTKSMKLNKTNQNKLVRRVFNLIRNKYTKRNCKKKTMLKILTTQSTTLNSSYRQQPPRSKPMIKHQIWRQQTQTYDLCKNLLNFRMKMIYQQASSSSLSSRTINLSA